MKNFDTLAKLCGLGNLQPCLFSPPMDQQSSLQQESAESGARNMPSLAKETTKADRGSCKKADNKKSNLTLGEKMEIIKCYTSTNPEVFMTQGQLATMFGKSRSAISKILKAENVCRLKYISGCGLHASIKRYAPNDSHLELEKRIHECIVEAGLGLGCRSQICKCAMKVASEMGVSDFKASHGWYSRFIKRHGLSRPRRTSRNAHVESNETSPTRLSFEHSFMPKSGAQTSSSLRHREMNFKVSLVQREKEAVFRHLNWSFDFDHLGNPVGGYRMVMEGLQSAFSEDLKGLPTSCLQLSYIDDDGDKILINSDQELGILLQDKPQAARIRLYLHAVSVSNRPPMGPSSGSLQPIHGASSVSLDMIVQGLKFYEDNLLVARPPGFGHVIV
ncbi:hypothetical protein GUITHDRAFT_119416 [Guillardia theta CCMP2712]|uniref:HTH CENPB-type domain-containing protein n=1 Tax=Guillardia theta (strain CCMP2712) TaxID=905079 RepID=L1IE99_GUITC|nr:hypothetical protein GUITHDRAFT_119416 [Guillardia theta CCMP2712]EKX34412.1 hypothetical protein GUITHDRAFT_119416 [Guillardia theta CCMP2712]|eukprot:XP_005821392.1 hypothetical protein GUITHDRAFT_119416 [Guillardia theta CCMP2712]